MTSRKPWVSPRIAVEAFEAKLDCSCVCQYTSGAGTGSSPVPKG